MRPRDRRLAAQLRRKLNRYDQRVTRLPGISDPRARDSLIEQMLESIRRTSYPRVIATRNISDRRADPGGQLFDPIKAAILFQRSGDLDEALWMVFLFVHFGRHPRAGYRYAREVYGCLGGPRNWDWQRTSADPQSFRNWFDANLDAFQTDGPHGFGNHRKYESLQDTGAVVESYVKWVTPPRSHQQLLSRALSMSNGDACMAFDYLYRNMDVTSFGRTARFDYLSMIGKLGLSPIEAGSPYLSHSTGPLAGARLLIGSSARPMELDAAVVQLGEHLRIGMEVLEDALCNWQKSPLDFRPFRS